MNSFFSALKTPSKSISLPETDTRRGSLACKWTVREKFLSRASSGWFWSVLALRRCTRGSFCPGSSVWARWSFSAGDASEGLCSVLLTLVVFCWVPWVPRSISCWAWQVEMVFSLGFGSGSTESSAGFSLARVVSLCSSLFEKRASLANTDLRFAFLRNFCLDSFDSSSMRITLNSFLPSRRMSPFSSLVPLR